MYVLTMYFSKVLESTEVIEIGLKSLGWASLLTSDTSVMIAVLHCCGMLRSASIWLNSCAMGAAKTMLAYRPDQRLLVGVCRACERLLLPWYRCIGPVQSPLVSSFYSAVSRDGGIMIVEYLHRNTFDVCDRVCTPSNNFPNFLPHIAKVPGMY